MSHVTEGLRQRGSWQVLLAVLVAAMMVLAAACAPAEEPDDDDGAVAPYEVWAVDQSTNLVHIYQPVEGDDNTSFEAVAVIDLTEHDVRTAHMISFSSDHAYAVVAATGSGDVTVIRTEDRQVVGKIATGPRSHMASFTADDARIIVDVIGSPDVEGDGAVVEVLADLEGETFEIGRTLTVADDPLIVDRADEFAATVDPVCHDYTADGSHAYVTLGPALAAGGLVVVDLDAFELVAAFTVDEVQVNCGTLLLPDGNMLVNGGGTDVGVWYVFDTETHDVIHEGDSQGEDAHGVWSIPDESEIWLVNRGTGNAIVIDAETYEVIDEMDEVGGTPDILAASPDGQFLFVSLRGPEPLTGATHLAAGPVPGFAVIDSAAREVYDVIQPEEEAAESDFHGIGVRVIGE